VGVLLLFLDGVGLGSPDPSVNPFAAARAPSLAALLGGPLTAERSPLAREGVLFSPLDAGLGVEGLPQSATGQTALLTGRNAALLMGRHYGPWPGPTLKRMLDKSSLFLEVARAGGRAGLVNAFLPGYLRALEARTGRNRLRVNVPVYATLAAGLELRTAADYAAGRAVSADLDGSALGAPKPLGEAGAALGRLAQGFEFAFFDFWLPDTAGHRWELGAAVALVEKLDAFLGGLLGALGETTLVVTSDHGNLEDKRTRSHTRNPVPLLAFGPQAAAFSGARDLTDLAPRVRAALTLAPVTQPVT
jgi:2,3-bisphosphoglycerate-independent phosphoglycerate mutase